MNKGFGLALIYEFQCGCGQSLKSVLPKDLTRIDLAWVECKPCGRNYKLKLQMRKNLTQELIDQMPLGSETVKALNLEVFHILDSVFQMEVEELP